MASRWLKNAGVQDLVEQFLGMTARRYELSAERIVQELCNFAFSNIQDYVRIDSKGGLHVDLSDITRDQAAAIQEITTEKYPENRKKLWNARNVKSVRFKLSGKVRSLELLIKYLKMFGGKNIAETGVKVVIIDVPRPQRPNIGALPANG